MVDGQLVHSVGVVGVNSHELQDDGLLTSDLGDHVEREVRFGLDQRIGREPVF